MSKYAIVVSASPGYTPGVNAQLNAMWHYGIDADFHLVHAGFDKEGGVYETFIDEIKADDFFGPRFFPVEVQSLKDAGYPQPPTKGNIVWYLKFYRYLYAVDRLKDYDAVAVFDADMHIVCDIADYFDIAAGTGKLLATNNDITGRIPETCRAGYPFHGAAGGPLSCGPAFFNPSKYEDFFNLLPEVGLKHNTSDMSAFNNTLVETSVIDDVLPLPAALWLQINLSFTPLAAKVIDDKHYILLHPKGGDRLFSFHRKFWLGGKCRQHIVNKVGLARDYSYHNIRIFWEMLRFLNLECRHRIAWDPSWGGFPDDLENIHPVSNTPCYPQP